MFEQVVFMNAYFTFMSESFWNSHVYPFLFPHNVFSLYSPKIRKIKTCSKRVRRGQPKFILFIFTQILFKFLSPSYSCCSFYGLMSIVYFVWFIFLCIMLYVRGGVQKKVVLLAERSAKGQIPPPLSALTECFLKKNNFFKARQQIQTFKIYFFAF